MRFPRAAALFLLCALPLEGRAAEASPGGQTRGTDFAAAGRGELVLHKWSGSINVPDPVACTVDPWGRVYVTSTTRRKVADLDIREHPQWIPDDVALSSIEEKRAFLQRELAPGKLRAPRGMLKDHNGDGSIDWRDLTHHSERIYQLRDTDGDGTADKITVFAEGFNTEVTGIAAGVLWHDGWLYATIAPDLWRLQDTDDDGVADVREIVVSGFGHHVAYAGHDMHGLVAGPDGRLYWSIGDKGLNVTSREGRRFLFPNEGATLRIEPDGSGFEVFTRGNRNVQEPAFNEWGDLIGVDNDADQPGERERLVHLVEGSDSGWRCNYQYLKTESPWMREGLWKPHFPGQAAYLLPPLLSYSDGPAGFKYHPGTGLGEAQEGLFLLNEFPSGKMRGFRLAAAGATYRQVEARVLNEGIMGIGLSWHPDGSLLQADWMGGYPLDELGALWRVDVAESARHPVRAETQAILEEGFGDRSALELLGRLGHADQRVRLGAQFELARRRRTGELLAVARAPTATLLARLHALWGYGQLLRRKAAETKAVLPLLRDFEAEVRAQAAKVLGDAVAAGAGGAGPELLPLLSDDSARVRLQAAIALGKHRLPEAVGALFALAEREGADPVMRHGAVFGLAGCAARADLVARILHPSTAVRLVAVVALRRQRDAAVAEFLRDADPLVAVEAARAIHDDESIPTALPALAALVGEPVRHEGIARRAINAALRVGTAEAAGRLLDLALNPAQPVSWRAEALETLRAWSEPPRLDRVDGWARTLQPAGIGPLLAAAAERLLGVGDPALVRGAMAVLIAHQVKAAPAQLAAMAGATAAPAELRAGALRLLAVEGRATPDFRRALDQALAPDAPTPLYRTALEMLLPGNPDRLIGLASELLARRGLPEKQLYFALLARAGTAAADARLDAAAAELLAGRLEPALHLDVLEALRAREAGNPALAVKRQAYERSAEGVKRVELLTGGEVARGRDLVANHLAANCTACHTVEAAGGSEVGPNLRTIGAQRDPAYLLESLLTPSAQIATGYGIVNVTLKDGTEIAGTLAKETPSTVTVRLFDGRQRILPRAEIGAQTPPASIMPPMEGVLQPRELRDVVAYLASLKGGRRAARGEEREK
ncbi:MAG: HEAT repeat domain-containing protein [Verrucomicrobia bacterium]|nr:HEAT repeat domain-containing protein [Verrucomicrobiota bacterium]